MSEYAERCKKAIARRKYDLTQESRLKKAREEYIMTVEPLMDVLSRVKAEGVLRITYNPESGESTTKYRPENLAMIKSIREHCDWIFEKIMTEHGLWKNMEKKGYK